MNQYLMAIVFLIKFTFSEFPSPVTPRPALGFLPVPKMKQNGNYDHAGYIFP
jgi:hypothetical protein